MMNRPSDWIRTRKTALIMKSPVKGNQSGNYRPIARLLLMWKTLTGIIADKLGTVLTKHLEHLEHLDCQGATWPLEE